MSLARLRARITIDNECRIIGLGGFAAMITIRDVKERGNDVVGLIIENRSGKVVSERKVTIRELYNIK